MLVKVTKIVTITVDCINEERFSSAHYRQTFSSTFFSCAVASVIDCHCGSPKRQTALRAVRQLSGRTEDMLRFDGLFSCVKMKGDVSPLI